MKIKLTSDLGEGYIDSIEIEDATLTEALVLTDAFFNDGKCVEEVQESVADSENEDEVQESEPSYSSPNWDNAPAWADYYGKTCIGNFVWYNWEKYQYEGSNIFTYFKNSWFSSPNEFTCLETNPGDAW